MQKYNLILIAAIVSIAVAARAQTNLPPTEIENFELQTGTVIVKGYGEVGTVTTTAGTISVRCKESSDATTGQKKYGIAVAFAGNNRLGNLAMIDYDELDSLVSGLQFLGGITYDVTSMPAFDASFATKSALRFTAHSERRQGGITDSLRFANGLRIPLTSDQLTQLQSLIAQAKTTLDLLKNKNSAP